jgi:poly-gamma-glutamate capsule biosynthesis protein CapA/YwtB (metallophosphatase superfamily)
VTATTAGHGVRIAAMGDAMLGRKVGERFQADPDSFAMSEFAAFLQGHDIVFLNLECPVSRNGRPDPIQKPNVTFCADPATLKVLQNLGVNIVSLGNNHMLDYGPEALVDTLRHLDEVGIRHAGAGRDYLEANEPLLLTVNGVKLAILSHVFVFSASTRRATRRNPGVSDYRIGPILARIRSLRAAGYLVVVSLHWGLEYAFYPVPYQRQQARQMIDAGASIILGHGPHFPQGIESYRHGKIVYSLGNFIFDEPYEYSNRSFLHSIQLAPDGELSEEQVVPFHIAEQVPRLSKGREREQMTRLVHGLSAAYGKKSRRYWRKISSRYFSDIVNRVLTMKSTRFLFLVPLSFYFDAGLMNILKKIRPRNFLALAAKLRG